MNAGGEFHYADGGLHAEGVPAAELARRFGTPVYVYSRAAIERQWREYDQAFGRRPHLVCYAVKANGNLAVLNLLARLGSGFDVVSGGELRRVIEAGGEPGKTVFSGVGKTRDEMHAALETDIRCFNVESLPELQLLNAVAGEMRRRAPVSIRVNPDIDARTHPYISTGLKENKFGIGIESAEAVYREAAGLPYIDIVGIDCHIGSQIASLDPHREAAGRVMQLVLRLKAAGITLRHIDLGGGLGIDYGSGGAYPTPGEFVRSLCGAVEDEDLEIVLEPGRSIVGNAGILLTRVLYLKASAGKHFAIVDAAMNDLIRPVLYDARQEILTVQEDPAGAEPRVYDVVGPVCESADFLGLGRRLAIRESDLLAVCGVGAYGFCMSSNYNARPRAAEIMVDGDAVHEIRRRESIEDLYRTERLLP